MIYAGFWQRFAAFWLDFLIFIPLIAVVMWADHTFRLFSLYYFVPGQVIALWFNVYLVKRYGGTPGKRLMRIRIVRLDGSPVGYPEAFIRHVVLFVLALGLALASVMVNWQMTDAEYHSMAWLDRAIHVQENLPVWAGPVNILMNIWIWGEFIVMMTNRKRRALHDFMAGTVVVRDTSPDLVFDAQP